MQIDDINPQEVEYMTKASEQEKERASFEALINYVMQSASDAQMFGARGAGRSYGGRDLYLGQ